MIRDLAPRGTARIRDMSDAKFTINRAGIEQITAEIKRKMDDAVGRVATECAGQPVDVVLAQLRRALVDARLHPNERGIREMAEDISKSSPLA